MITLKTPLQIKEPEKVIGTVNRYQITGFSFIDDLNGSYAQVTVTGYNVAGDVLTPIQTIPVVIGQEEISANPAYVALHTQVKDALEQYLVAQEIIPAS